MRNIMMLLAWVLLFFSANSYAETYSWGAYGMSETYPSPALACEAKGKLLYASNPKFKSSSMALATNTIASCSVTYEFADGSEGTAADSYTVQRYGDSCPVGSAYDFGMGKCLSAQKNGEMCEDQQGQTAANPMIYSEASGGCVALGDADLPAQCASIAGNTPNGGQAYNVTGMLDTGGEAVAPPKFVPSGFNCELETIDTSECTINVKGAVSCNVTAKWTGKVGNSGGVDTVKSECAMNNSCPPVEVTTSVTDTPCTMNNGTCTSETETEKTGTQKCGSVNGSFVCITEKPSSNGIKIVSEEAVETLLDGSKKSTKKDNATKTVCKDVNNCTVTKSTTTTTTTTTKSGGTSTKTTCAGECGGTGKGVGSGSEGSGEEGDGGLASASESCQTKPICDGDAYLCTIIRQEYIDSCAERALPTDDEKAGFAALLEKQRITLDAQTKEFDDQTSILVSQFESAASGTSSGGKCFTDFHTSVRGHSFVIPFSQVCPYLEYLRWAVLCMAYLIALRIIMKEL
jgi:hypothetical protein